MAKLTKRVIDRLAPSARDVITWDEMLPRFGVRQKPGGAASYVVQYRNAENRSRRLTIGRVGVLTPDEARKLARQRLAEVTGGADPAAERQAALRDPTVAELCGLYLDEGPAAKPTKRDASWAQDRSSIDRHIIPLLGLRKLRALDTRDVEKFQHDVKSGLTAAKIRTRRRGRAMIDGGPGAARRATIILAAILNFAVHRKLRLDNPARGVRLHPLKRRERLLSGEELARLGATLVAFERDGTNRKAIDAIRLLLFTGARRNEILGLHWDYVDLERRALRLPESKTGAKTVPLSKPAIEVLSAIERELPSPFVFPATNGNGFYVGLNAVWRRLRRIAGLSDVRLHDLRHAFASVAVAHGASLFIVGRALGHTQPRTTAKYAHLDLDPVLAVVDQTASRIHESLSPAPAAVEADLTG